MSSYSINEINKIVGGSFICQSTDSTIEHLLIDSRKTIFSETSLFFAIRGEQRDGHFYIEDAYNKGVRNFVVSRKFQLKPFLKANVIQVEDTTLALQKLAKHHREQFGFPVIGITGSNGKTIVKEWLYDLMYDDMNIVRSPKSYNSQIGVPLSIWQMDETQELGLFEAGISEVGEMEKLQQIIQPDIVILTNIGSAHDLGFKNRQQKIQEKLKLHGDSAMLIYCRDHEKIHKELFKSKQTIRTLNWSTEQEADIQYTLTKEAKQTTVEATYRGQEFRFKLPFTDATSIENALHCCCVLLSTSNYHDTAILNEKLARLHSMPMRLEQKEGVNNCVLIDDTYNADLQSLKIALDFQQQQNAHLKNSLVLTDILQTGKKAKSLYKDIAKLVAQKNIHRLVGIGEEIQANKSFFDSVEKTSFYNTVDDFIKNGTVDQFNSECILFKGARSFGLERAVNALSQKMHRTVLEIDLNSINHNLNVYRQKLDPDTKIMAMVKALSYGAGSYQIANALEFAKVDYLAVAYTDEGVDLRKAGISLPIMVLNPDKDTYSQLLEYNLEPEIYSFNQLNLFAQFLNENADQPVNIHLNIDTGMNRLGFELGDMEQLLIDLKKNQFLTVKSAFSHLVASDDLKHEDFTIQQIESFKEAASELEEGLGNPIIKHILNTSGITNFGEHQMDMVRLGLGLYGIDANTKMQEKLSLVSRLKSYIAQIKTVEKGESIGYNRLGKVNRKMQIATVCLGYGDGLPRMVGNRRFNFTINGERASIVGNVCMDMCMVDVTAISNVNEGDEVIIFDDAASLMTLSNAAMSIPYEILTGISGRVKRIYFKD